MFLLHLSQGFISLSLLVTKDGFVRKTLAVFFFFGCHFTVARFTMEAVFTLKHLYLILLLFMELWLWLLVMLDLRLLPIFHLGLCSYIHS